MRGDILLFISNAGSSISSGEAAGDGKVAAASGPTTLGPGLRTLGPNHSVDGKTRRGRV